MFWALVLSVTTGHLTTEYAIDTFRNAGDCASALRQAQRGRREAVRYYETRAILSCVRLPAK